LTPKCDLELGGRDEGVANETITYYSDYLWQVSMKKLCTGHKIYPLTDYVNFWPPSVTLTLVVGDRFCAWHIVSLLWTIVASIYKIPSKIRKILTRHDINHQIDNVDLEWEGATLTMEVAVWLLRMTHCLIITNICAKLIQIYLINDKVMNRTRKCDERTDGRTEGRTDRRTEPITISLFFSSKRRGTMNNLEHVGSRSSKKNKNDGDIRKICFEKRPRLKYMVIVYFINCRFHCPSMPL
jgi:hypothetical protein